MLLASLLSLTVLTARAAPPKLPDCIHLSTAAANPVFRPDLDSVRDCQDKARQKLIDQAQARGKPLSYRRIEEIDDAQRAEAKEFLERSGTVIDGTNKNDRGLGGLSEQDRARASPGDADALKGLEQRLHEAAGDGKNGITPSMGRDILDTLTQRQGGVSPDMKALIDSVVKDGGKLTPETMKQLQGAGQQAKGAGLDLGIDKGVEKSLLEHDFDKDKDAPPPPPADPGNL